MTNYTDYTTYFKDIATDLLGHSDSEKHFFRKGLEEFLNGMQTEVNYPAMLLGKYDFTYDDNGADNIMKVRTVAFIICDHVNDIEDYNQTDSAFDVCEELVDKIINRVYADSKWPKHDFMKYTRLGNVQVTPIDNSADGTFGYFVTIPIYTIHNTAL